MSSQPSPGGLFGLREPWSKPVIYAVCATLHTTQSTRHKPERKPAIISVADNSVSHSALYIFHIGCFFHGKRSSGGERNRDSEKARI